MNEQIKFEIKLHTYVIFFIEKHHHNVSTMELYN